MCGIVAEGVRVGAFDPSVDPERMALEVLSRLDGLVAPLALSDPSLPTRDLPLSTLADLVGTGPGARAPAERPRAPFREARPARPGRSPPGRPRRPG